MSEQPADTREYLEVPSLGGVAFDALMDALVAEEAAAPGSGEGAAAGAAGAPASDAPAVGADPAGAGAAAAGQPAGQPAEGAGGAPAGDPAGQQPEPAAAAGAGPGTGSLAPAVAAGNIAKFAPAIEEKVTKAYQQQAYDAAREEYKQYFDALEKHPRLLVGQQVPAIGKDGMETLRDSADAKEWQEAVRSILVEDIKARAQVKIEESKGYLETLHSSISLFQNNADLIPGTQSFDAELANRFAEMAKPYEVRVEGKLHGYSIPVQPIIDSLRGQLQAQRSQPPAVSAPAAPAGAPAVPAPSQPVEPPQAAIPAKAGNSAEKEDFSTLFGTIGLPHLQI